MAISRSNFETELAAALSRHIGYTTGAYEVHRIANVAAMFRHTPSLYQYQMVRQLMDWSEESQRHVGEKYAAEIINFANALGILRKVADGPTPGARRYALTPEGFTIRSALKRGPESLLRFTLIGLVLESDCDAYGLLLDLLDERRITGAELHRAFRVRFDELRSERLDWLERAFPNQTLRNRIHEKISWIPHRGRIKLASTDFGRHHVTPRLGWARWFGHITTGRIASSTAEGSLLTDRGIELLCALRRGTGRYTWLGPECGTQEGLRIVESLRRCGPFAPSWNLLRPADRRQSKADVVRLAEDVADFMDSHYTDLRLVHANQASIASVVPYLHLREHQLGYSVERDSVFDRVFEMRSSFNYLSSRIRKYGYFRLASQ